MHNIYIHRPDFVNLFLLMQYVGMEHSKFACNPWFTNSNTVTVHLISITNVNCQQTSELNSCRYCTFFVSHDGEFGSLSKTNADPYNGSVKTVVSRKFQYHKRKSLVLSNRWQKTVM